MAQLLSQVLLLLPRQLLGLCLEMTCPQSLPHLAGVLIFYCFKCCTAHGMAHTS